MIIPGAPVEHLPFEGWTTGRNSSRSSSGLRPMFSTLHICWGAQAGLYVRYGVEKHQMDRKLSGIYPQDTLKEGHLLFRGLMIAM